MYMPWSAPIGAGGQPEPFVPRIVSDTAGNPLPLQPAIPQARPGVGVPLASGAVGAPVASFTFPPMLPRFSYGGGLIPSAAGSGGTAGAAGDESPTFSQVLPWVDYGSLSDNGAFGPTDQGDAGSYNFARWAFFGGGDAGGGEPPWSDALAGSSACCGGSNLWDWVKAHPLIAAAVAVGLVVVVKGSD